MSLVYVGMLSTQVIGGWLSLVVGPKIVLGISILFGSVFTMVSPLAANFSYIMLMVLRLFIGVSQVRLVLTGLARKIKQQKHKWHIFKKGCVSSSINVLFASWTPPTERSTLVSISNSGSLVGNVLFCTGCLTYPFLVSGIKLGK